MRALQSIGTGIIIGSAGMLAASRADASAILSNPGGSDRTLANYVVGYQFTVGPNSLLVSDLGYFDSPANPNDATSGLADSHDIAIYTDGQGSTGVTVATATVDAGTTDPQTDDFRYALTFTPVVLAANTTYIIGAETGPDTDQFGDSNSNGTITLSADATGYYTYYTSGGTLQFPGTPNQPNTVYFGPNFQYTVLPEPASLGLLGAGALGLLVRRRRD